MLCGVVRAAICSRAMIYPTPAGTEAGQSRPLLCVEGVLPVSFKGVLALLWLMLAVHASHRLNCFPRGLQRRRITYRSSTMWLRSTRTSRLCAWWFRLRTCSSSPAASSTPRGWSKILLSPPGTQATAATWLPSAVPCRSRGPPSPPCTPSPRRCSSPIDRMCTHPYSSLASGQKSPACYACHRPKPGAVPPLPPKPAQHHATLRHADTAPVRSSPPPVPPKHNLDRHVSKHNDRTGHGHMSGWLTRHSSHSPSRQAPVHAMTPPANAPDRYGHVMHATGRLLATMTNTPHAHMTARAGRARCTRWRHH